MMAPSRCAAGRTTIRVDGKGSGCALPPLDTFGLPLRVQLRSGNGQCWEANHSTTDVIRHDTQTFKARPD